MFVLMSSMEHIYNLPQGVKNPRFLIDFAGHHYNTVIVISHKWQQFVIWFTNTNNTGNW